MDRLLEERKKRLENKEEKQRLVRSWHKVFSEVFELPDDLSYIESNLWTEITNDRKHCFTVVELMKENQDLVKETIKIRPGFVTLLNEYPRFLPILHETGA